MPKKIEVTRKPQIKDKDTVIMNSTAYEEMSQTEFMNMYSKKAGEVEQDKEACAQGKQQLIQIEQIEETAELKKFAENMKQCELIKNKVSLQFELRDMEVRIQAKEKELKDMSATFIELQKQQRQNKC